MDARQELNGIGNGLGKVGQGFASIFDKDHREARKAIADAERDAAKQITEAQAAAAKESLRTSTQATIDKIKAGAGEAAHSPTPAAAKPAGFFGRRAQAVGNQMQSAFKGGVWLIEQPIALVLKPVKWVANGVGNAFIKAPVKSTAAASVVALVAGGTWLANRRSKTMMNELEAQAMTAQASQPTYMNTASQMDVDARMAADRAAGIAPAGQAAAVNAAREQVQAPEAARG